MQNFLSNPRLRLVRSWCNFNQSENACDVRAFQAWNVLSFLSHFFPMITQRRWLPGPNCHNICFRSSSRSQRSIACLRVCRFRKFTQVWIARKTRLCAVALNCMTAILFVGLRCFGLKSWPAKMASSAIRWDTSKISPAPSLFPGDRTSMKGLLMCACEEIGMLADKLCT